MNGNETFAFIFILVILAICTAVYACLRHNGNLYRDDEGAPGSGEILYGDMEASKPASLEDVE